MPSIPKSILRSTPLVLALAAMSLPMAQTRAEDPAKPPVSSEERARERAARDAAFKSLEDELKAMLGEYTKSLQEAQKRGVPREQWPRSPVNDYFSRFEALALQDQPDSLRWCLGVMSSVEMTIDERVSKKDALYKRYVASCLDAPFTADIVQFLTMDANPDGIGVERSAGFLDQIAKGASSTEVRVKALWAKAQAYQRGTKPEHKDLYLAALKDLVKAYPSSTEGASAKGLLFQIERLQIGMTAPDVSATDVEGKAFKLSDTRGKPTLLVFFAFAHRAGPPLVAKLKELRAEFQGKPLEIVGVTLDEKKEEFKTALAAAGVDWNIAWQGGRSGAWVSEWGVNRLPFIYVLDDRGVIRATNVELPAIRALVAEIQAEMKSRSKEKEGQ